MFQHVPTSFFRTKNAETSSTARWPSLVSTAPPLRVGWDWYAPCRESWESPPQRFGTKERLAWKRTQTNCWVKLVQNVFLPEIGHFWWQFLCNFSWNPRPTISCSIWFWSNHPTCPCMVLLRLWRRQTSEPKRAAADNFKANVVSFQFPWRKDRKWEPSFRNMKLMQNPSIVGRLSAWSLILPYLMTSRINYTVNLCHPQPDTCDAAQWSQSMVASWGFIEPKSDRGWH